MARHHQFRIWPLALGIIKLAQEVLSFRGGAAPSEGTPHHLPITVFSPARPWGATSRTVP